MEFNQFNIFRNTKNNIFINGFNENIKGTICGIKFDSNILYILPNNIDDLNNIQNYHNIKYLEINNFKIGKRADDTLASNVNVLKNITHLMIWNIKQNDLEILKYFPQLTHLLVSYIRKDDFSFTGLNYTDKINTLSLSSVNRIKNFNFLDKSVKTRIKNLSVTYCKELTNFTGIAGYKNLECLKVCVSTPESGKRIPLENISGIEKMDKLKYFELGYYKLNIDELKNKIIGLRKLKEFIIDYKKYDNKIK